MKKYVVELTEDERVRLHKLISAGSAPARMLNRARILLKADVGGHAEGEPLIDRQIAPMLETSTATVQRVRERFLGRARCGARTLDARSGLGEDLRREGGGPPDRARLLGGARGSGALEHEALGGQGGADGHRGERFPRDGEKDAQKNELRPHLVKGWVIPPRQSARFVWRMEEVLDLYEEPYDEKRPVVCFEERPCQLLAEVREPLGVGTGVPERRDHEYERRGMAHLFVAFEPLTGRRSVEVRERRRGREFAEFGRHLAEDLYPEAEKIRLVVDNLNIHSAASFYEVFDAERARELTRRVEFRYTPVHGSWLNMAEIEISVLVRQCLGAPRIPEAEILRREARAWSEERNRLGASVDWRFTTAEARTKLRRLYPSIER